MFQERLNRLRKERGLSQEDLAGIIGVSRQAVQKWESGTSSPDTDNLIALADYFGVSLDYLLRGTQAQPAPAGQEEPPAWARSLLREGLGWHYEYKSRRTFHGLPLVHINVGVRGWGHRARGVIAIGNAAVGVVAVGAASLGLVSVGAAGVGLLSLGGIALGLLALGGLAAGGIALGGVALGWLALGGAAIGTYAAGGAAVARNVALGNAAMGNVAIGWDAAGSAATLLTPVSPQAVQAAILQAYPHIPGWLLSLFSALA